MNGTGLNLSVLLIFAVLLPFSILILNIWLWLFNNIFQFQNNKKKILIITIFMGMIGGLSIVVYPLILGIFHLDYLNFTKERNDNFVSKLNHFGIYLLIIVLFTKFILLNFKFSKLFLFNLMVFAVLLLLSGLGQNFIVFGTLAKYYIFVALGEEFVKFFIGINFYEKFKLSKSDIIIFAILSALGFAFIENIVYMLGGLTGNEFVVGLIGSTGILITRGVIGFMVHILFTGNIGFFSMKGLNKNFYILSAIGVCTGLSLHYSYNLLLSNNYKIVILIYLVIGYFWISYLFYKSDRLYLKQGIEAYY